MDSEKTKTEAVGNGFKTKESTQISSPKKPTSQPIVDAYAEFLEYSKHREGHMADGMGKVELAVLAKEIDDERTGKDLNKIKILEVGCLNGIAMKILRQDYGITNIEGIDINEYSPAMCKLHGGICKQIDVMNLDGKYDIIYMQHLSEDLDFMAKVIEKCLKQARKKVLVILNVPDEKAISDMVRKIPNENHRYIKDIVSYQTADIVHKIWLIVFYNQKDTKKEEE